MIWLVAIFGILVCWYLHEIEKQITPMRYEAKEHFARTEAYLVRIIMQQVSKPGEVAGLKLFREPDGSYSTSFSPGPTP
jgi:hypothetical protein